MSASPLARAADEFLQDEHRRQKKPRFSAEDRNRLSFDVMVLREGDRQDGQAFARRGEVAVGIFGYNDTFENAAESVIADILHALNARGIDPLTTLAHARASYFKEVPVSLAEQAFIENPTED